MKKQFVFPVVACVLFVLLAGLMLGIPAEGIAVGAIALAAFLGFIAWHVVAITSDDAPRVKKSVDSPNSEEKQSPRPDVPATRQWVSELLDSNTSNCMRVGGHTHNKLISQITELETRLEKLEPPHYYILTAEGVVPGERLGRIFEGRGVGIARTKAIALVNGLPRLMTLEEEALYKNWSDQADWEYQCNCNHTMSEQWGVGYKMQVLTQEEADIILNFAEANDLRWK